MITSYCSYLNIKSQCYFYILCFVVVFCPVFFAFFAFVPAVTFFSILILCTTVIPNKINNNQYSSF